MNKIGVLLTTFIVSIVLVNTNILANSASQDEVDGTFETTGYNNPVEVIGFESESINLTPNSSNRFKIKLEDLDSMRDIQLLELRFYFVPNGDSIEDTFNATTTTTDDGTKAVYKWEQNNSTGAQNGFRIVSGSEGNVEGTSDVGSWGAVNYLTQSGLQGAVYPYSDEVDDSGETIDSTQFQFEVEIEISKVARYTGTSNDEGSWYLGLKIEDGLVDNDSLIHTTTVAALGISSTDPVTETDTAFQMQWYGEVELDGSNDSIEWSDVIPGSSDMTNESSLFQEILENVIFRSNSSYDILISSEEFWDIENTSNVPKAVSKATLNESGDLTVSQEFSIKTSVTDDFGQSNFLTLTDGTLDNVVNPTNEDGDEVDIYFWLGVANEFQNADYNGTITLKVSNN